MKKLGEVVKGDFIYLVKHDIEETYPIIKYCIIDNVYYDDTWLYFTVQSIKGKSFLLLVPIEDKDASSYDECKRFITTDMESAILDFKEHVLRQK